MQKIYAAATRSPMAPSATDMTICANRTVSSRAHTTGPRVD
jgi:hypothetical protein